MEACLQSQIEEAVTILRAVRIVVLTILRRLDAIVICEAVTPLMGVLPVSVPSTICIFYDSINDGNIIHSL